MQSVSVPIAMLGDIKIAHSVFALPFALLGGAMAAWPPAWSGVTAIGGGDVLAALVLVIAAMVAARTAAMLANRIIDRELDARNPRTAGRPLAAGTVSLRAYVVGWSGVCLCFVVIAFMFWWAMGNPWPAILSLPVLAWICAYGLLKRFHGAVSPVAGRIAGNECAGCRHRGQSCGALQASRPSGCSRRWSCAGWPAST